MALSITDDGIHSRVEVGGVLSSHKGVNLPGVTLDIEAVTKRDLEVLTWGIDAGVDLVAQSFVRGASDVQRLRELGGPACPPVVAKVEKHEAIENIEEIVETADVVMVARGDLGVETSPEAVPVLQRRVIDMCHTHGKPVIVATQMLESMILAPRPTRAEASDVANAIFDSVDAVMLSAETAIGEYPVKSVETMARIAETAESVAQEVHTDRRSVGDSEDVTAAVSAAVCDLAEDLELAAIITATQSGSTARAVARHRPTVPIIAATPYASVAQSLGHVWGVTAVVVPLSEDTDKMLHNVVVAVRESRVIEAEEKVAITAGISTRTPGATDFILVRTVPRA